MDKKTQLLSNLIITPQQRLILIIDNTGRERSAQRILRQFLSEQGQDETTIKILPLNNRLQQPSTFARFLNECVDQKQNHKPLNIILPTLADLLCYQSPAIIFEFMHELHNCDGIQRTLLWASTQHLIYPKVNYLLAACEYLSDCVIHLLEEQSLRLTARKPNGGVINKSYAYKINKNEFFVENVKSVDQKAHAHGNIEHESTFKIELEEEELIARNALKLPYEKTNETGNFGGGNIVYTPDAIDDFDDEDPDEDLCI